MSRLEGLSDAVFGFSLTLLVVSLEVPKTTADLVRVMVGFIPFAFCFFSLSMVWFCRMPILASCPEGGIVLDPFCGTGTTNLVAFQLGRRSVGIDVSVDLLRTGGRMIDTTPSTPGDIVLVGFRIFPEIMEPTGQRGSLPCIELGAQHFGS